MTRAPRPRLLPWMLVLLATTAGAVFVYSAWLEQRRRPPLPPPEPVPASVPAARELQAEAPARTLHRCVAEGAAPIYTTDPCPPGTTLSREVEVARMRSESPELQRARRQCEAGRQRERLELARLGARRSQADVRLWGDYALRECAAYTALVR